jgi:hypothetical protein
MVPGSMFLAALMQDETTTDNNYASIKSLTTVGSTKA